MKSEIKSSVIEAISESNDLINEIIKNPDCAYEIQQYLEMRLMKNQELLAQIKNIIQGDA